MVVDMGIVAKEHRHSRQLLHSTTEGPWLLKGQTVKTNPQNLVLCPL